MLGPLVHLLVHMINQPFCQYSCTPQLLTSLQLPERSQALPNPENYIKLVFIKGVIGTYSRAGDNSQLSLSKLAVLKLTKNIHLLNMKATDYGTGIIKDCMTSQQQIPF